MNISICNARKLIGLKILILGAAELQIALPFGQRPLVRQNGQPFHSSEAQEPSSPSEEHRQETNKTPHYVCNSPILIANFGFAENTFIRK
jgi:hypothetical protein